MPKTSKQSYTVYIVRCRNGSLYTGIAKDLDKRIKDHNQGKGAKYTRAFGPVVLVWSKRFRNRSAALSREAQIKNWPRAKKMELILKEKTN